MEHTEERIQPISELLGIASSIETKAALIACADKHPMADQCTLIRKITPVYRSYRTPYSLRPLLLSGLLSLILWGGVYILFFSRTLWHASALVLDHWPALFLPIQSMFPWRWLTADRSTVAALPTIVAWMVLSLTLCGIWMFATIMASRIATSDPWIAAEGLRIILVGVVCSSGLLIFTLGLTSSDVYGYIWYGHIAGVLHANPFTHAPIEFSTQDPGGWMAHTNWNNAPSVYGPTWIGLAALLARLVHSEHGSLVNQVLVQRTLAAELHLFNTVLIWNLAGKIIPRLQKSSDIVRTYIGSQLSVTIFYGWCPLLIWDFANNAHNDVLLVFWLLVAIWCHLRGVARQEVHGKGSQWWLIAVAAITLAGLVKVTAFLLLPAYIVLISSSYTCRQSWIHRLVLTMQAFAVVLVVSTVLYMPYWE